MTVRAGVASLLLLLALLCQGVSVWASVQGDPQRAVRNQLLHVQAVEHHHHSDDTAHDAPGPATHQHQGELQQAGVWWPELRLMPLRMAQRRAWPMHADDVATVFLDGLLRPPRRA